MNENVLEHFTSDQPEKDVKYSTLCPHLKFFAKCLPLTRPSLLWSDKHLLLDYSLPACLILDRFGSVRSDAVKTIHLVSHPKQGPGCPFSELAEPAPTCVRSHFLLQHLCRSIGHLSKGAHLAETILSRDRSELVEAHRRHSFQELRDMLNRLEHSPYAELQCQKIDECTHVAAIRCPASNKACTVKLTCCAAPACSNVLDYGVSIRPRVL